MHPFRHPLAVAEPGLAALVLAAIALARGGGDDSDRIEVRAVEEPRQAAARSFSELYERVDGAVARIDARRGPQDPPFANGRRVATGAAFLIDDRGHVVTNAHVVDRARSATLRFGRSTKRIPARIVGRDTTAEGGVASVLAAHRLGDRVRVRLADRTVTVTLGRQPRGR